MSRTRPRVEGLPAERPRCATCGKPLAYWTKDERARRAGDLSAYGDVIKRTFERWRGYPRRDPIFDTLTCAERFATASYRAGYRLVTPKEASAP